MVIKSPVLGSGTRAFVLKRNHVRHGIDHYLNSLTGPVRVMSLGFHIALERQETPYYSILWQYPLIKRLNSEQITQDNVNNGPNYLLETHGSLLRFSNLVILKNVLFRSILFRSQTYVPRTEKAFQVLDINVIRTKLVEKIEVKMKSRTFRKCSWISVLLKQQFLIQTS